MLIDMGMKVNIPFKWKTLYFRSFSCLTIYHGLPAVVFCGGIRARKVSALLRFYDSGSSR